MCPAPEFDDEPVVGVVRESDAGERTLSDVLPARSDRDPRVVEGDLETVLEAAPSLLVAAGTADLSAVARARPGVPVLPVGDVPGLETVAADRLPAAVDAALEGASRVRRRDLLTVDVETPDGESAAGSFADERALFDVALVTAEPARISEYGVYDREEEVTTVRADGIVAATPAGCHGYADAVDAPRGSPDIDAVAVAPVAPFVRNTRRWVLPTADVVLTVERDEGDVVLVVDGRELGSLSLGSRVALAADGTLSTVVPDEPVENE